MSWLVTARQYIPAVIGEEFGGGYFAGYISHTANGNPTHALILAPKATGATGSGYTLSTSLAWALNQNAGNGTNYSTNTIGATTPAAAKDYDGVALMQLMVAIGISNFPAAEFCKNLNIGQYNDWYLPSRFELEIAYFNLKPTTEANQLNVGANSYAVPLRSSNYTANFPSQTPVSAFASSGSEAFVATGAANLHWTSTEFAGGFSNFLGTTTGGTGFAAKTSTQLVRAFRRITL